MGPEPLSNSFSESHLNAALKGRKTPIKAALLDQRIVAGLGNIYVCEALFRAGISPKRLAGSVAGARGLRLYGAIRTVLNDAIEAGGSTLRDFATADGGLGYFQHRFDVYDREGEDCRSCGGPISRIVQSGRSTFFCSRCQR
jgi:formamidopyrimidine-DNA glycosylase